MPRPVPPPWSVSSYREYILKQLNDIEELEKQIADFESILKSRNRVYTIIIKELENIIKKYGKPRKTVIIDAEEIAETEEISEEIPDYPVHIFFTKDGYFKKITPLSLRMSSEQKLKEGDEMKTVVESNNLKELLFFTNKHQVYKTRVSDFEDSKASVLGDYIPGKLQMEEGETTVGMAITDNYAGYMLFVFDNGRVAKVI